MKRSGPASGPGSTARVAIAGSLASVAGGDVGVLDHGDESFELGDRRVDIEPLLGQQVDAGSTLLDRHPALRGAIVVEIVEVDHLAYLGEAETHPLAAQDPGEPGTVAPAVDPDHALALRRDQAFILVEAKRPRGDSELLAQIGDPIALAAGLGRLEV